MVGTYSERSEEGNARDLLTRSYFWAYDVMAVQRVSVLQSHVGGPVYVSVTKPLKKALRMMGAPNLISDNIDCGLSYSVISYLKKLSQQVTPP